MDNTLQKARYDAGFINGIDIQCILLKARVSINRMASGLWLRDRTWVCVLQAGRKQALGRVSVWYAVIYM